MQFRKFEKTNENRQTLHVGILEKKGMFAIIKGVVFLLFLYIGEKVIMSGRARGIIAIIVAIAVMCTGWFFAPKQPRYVRAQDYIDLAKEYAADEEYSMAERYFYDALDTDLVNAQAYAGLVVMELERGN